jgi:hypothetical protein
MRNKCNFNLLALVFLAAIFLTTGCHSSYNIYLTNGMVLTSVGKPAYDKQRGIYIYTDAAGNKHKASAGSVTQISPSSMSQDNPYSFKTNSAH